MSDAASKQSLVLEQLLQELPHAVVLDPEQLRTLMADKSGHTSAGPPLCVVEALSIEDVVKVVTIASQHQMPLVTRGAGSGLAGGAIGGPGEIVLSLAKMNAILEISASDRWAVVQAGVINHDLNEAAKKQGLWFTPDPASRKWSTVGGNIATNAGGLLCMKYGVTRESVLELTVVLASGEILKVGHKSVKGVTGYDLAALMVGSEGTLGIICEARVSLEPLDPHPVWTISGRASQMSVATTAIEHTIARGLKPAIMELLDEASVRHISDLLGQKIDHPGTVQLIAQTDGPGSEEEAERIAETWRECGIDVEVGRDREDLIEFRRSMHPAMEAQGTVLIEDVAVPRSQIGAMFAAIREIEKEFGIEIPTVAHAGDGNLHPNFLYTGDEVPAEIWSAADALFRQAVALGGTLTGEHGVGLLKRKWLLEELGQTQWELQRKIKEVFDPLGILNPGKVFTP
jgi:glycolate oxidase